MPMAAGGVAAYKTDRHIQRKNDESRSHKPLSHDIHSLWQAKVKEDDGSTEQSHRKRMAERIQKPKLHALTPAALYARNIGDRCQVVVVEAVTKAQQSAGKQSEFERGGHLLVAYEVMGADARTLATQMNRL